MRHAKPNTIRPPRMSVQVRWSIRRDLGAMQRIDEATFEEYWTEDEFLQRARQPNYICLVAEHCERVVGFLAYELHPDYMRIVRMAVDPSCRRRSVGLSLISKIVGKLVQCSRKEIVIEVPDTHLDAHLFLSECGFWAVDVLHGDDRRRDEYLFQFPAPDPDERGEACA